jgi:hypothetical protein
MKPFESTGLWFLPEDADTQVPGTVEFSQDDGFRLRLSGSFQHTWNIDAARYPIIRGAVSDSPYGKFITLFNCVATNLRFGMPGAAVETIHATHGFAGTDFVDSDAMPFDGAAMYFSTLGAWLNFSGLTFEHDPKGMRVIWRRPEQLECKVDDAVISTTFAFSTKGGPLGGAITLEETPAFMLGAFGSATADDIHSRFFAPLSNLMTFASDGKSNLDRYTLYKSADKPGGSDQFDRLYSPAVTYNKSESHPTAIDFLFSLNDVRERYEPFMQKWFTFVKTHPDFCKMFFSYGYEKHGFLETRFLFQMVSAECLVREENQDDATMKFFESMREAFLKTEALIKEPYATVAFPSAIQMAMPTLFGKLVNRQWPLVSEMVGTTEGRFTEALFATLEFVNTRGKQSQSAVGGTHLYWLLARLTAVLKICILKRLEFTDEKIKEIVNRNAQMNLLKTRKAPWKPDKDGD